VWISLGAANPFANYIVQVDAVFKAFEQAIDEETAAATSPSASCGGCGR